MQRGRIAMDKKRKRYDHFQRGGGEKANSLGLSRRGSVIEEARGGEGGLITLKRRLQVSSPAKKGDRQLEGGL